MPVKISTSLASGNTDLIVGATRTVPHQTTSLVTRNGPKIKTGNTKIVTIRRTGKSITHRIDIHGNTEMAIMLAQHETE
jgi:hypothetical protein